MRAISYSSILTVCALMLCSSFFSPETAHGSSSTDVDARIQISVCGNFVAEDDEDCDNSDLKGASCQSLGYDEGPLSCNISCNYDTTACIVPTATPVISQISQPTGINKTSQVIKTSEEQQSSQREWPGNSIQNTIENILRRSPVQGGSALPPGLRYFDFNNVGKILLGDLRKVVTIWVDDWQKSLLDQKTAKNCDVNEDDICDLKDFSILMAYVEE